MFRPSLSTSLALKYALIWLGTWLSYLGYRYTQIGPISWRHAVLAAALTFGGSLIAWIVEFRRRTNLDWFYALMLQICSCVAAIIVAVIGVKLAFGR